MIMAAASYTFWHGQSTVQRPLRLNLSRPNSCSWPSRSSKSLIRPSGLRQAKRWGPHVILVTSCDTSNLLSQCKRHRNFSCSFYHNPLQVVSSSKAFLAPALSCLDHHDFVPHELALVYHFKFIKYTLVQPEYHDFASNRRQ